ncbi:MAG TPA: response regulator [Thermoanaerobaculia bacterium]|nr:response regulator [Thermoanaerobaculia bacterium]
MGRNGSNTPHALIVEDNPAELAGLAAFVATEGFRTSRASNLEEARRVLRRCAPDLILCDYLLPDGHGTELLDDLDPHGGNVEFVLVTSSVDAPEVQQREHLPKPVDLGTVQRILARIRSQTGGRGNGGQGATSEAGSEPAREVAKAAAYSLCSYALSRL